MKTKNPFRHTWKDYFSFSNRERKGLLVLFSLFGIEAMILFYLHFSPVKNSPVDFSQFEKEVVVFLAASANAQAQENQALPETPGDSIQNTGSGIPSGKKTELFAFDPNNLPADDWKRLGFTEKQILSIKKYEGKGGTFRSKEDVKKMYAIREDEYKRLEPFIVIPEKKTDRPKKNFRPNGKKTLVVDVGVADSTEFEKLPLIGYYLASKICHYREMLGGFYSIAQVQEVRGLSDSVFQVIRPLLVLTDSTNLRRMNINRVEYAELNRHPYISGSVARVIVNYRDQHGSFHSPEDLRKVALVNDELYRKIAPYLKAE